MNEDNIKNIYKTKCKKSKNQTINKENAENKIQKTHTNRK